MTLSAATVFEVESGGSDNNGGGFVTGASGTDFSQQPAAQYALTGLTTAAANAIIQTTSAAAVMVGNLINIVSGTNFTAGVYQILSVVAGVSITVDKNCTTAAGAAGVGNIGGAFATPAKALAQMTVTGMIGYVKAATYSISTGLSSGTISNPTGGLVRLVGYSTTRGDLGQPTIQATASINGFTDGQGGFRLENFIFDGNALTGSNGIVFSSGASSVAFNCNIKNWASGAMTLNSSYGSVIQSSMTGCGSGVYCQGTGALIKNCYINGNTGAGVNVISQGVNIIGNIISNNSGASTDGITFSNNYAYVKGIITGNILYANGRHGILSTGNYEVSEISNNIFVNNGGFGLNLSVTPATSDVGVHHNAFYNNTSGARNGGIAAGIGDVTLTGVPFVNAGAANYALNSASGQGAACRSAGYPGVLSAGGTGFLDMGPIQSPQNISISTHNAQIMARNGTASY